MTTHRGGFFVSWSDEKSEHDTSPDASVISIDARAWTADGAGGFLLEIGDPIGGIALATQGRHGSTTGNVGGGVRHVWLATTTDAPAVQLLETAGNLITAQGWSSDLLTAMAATAAGDNPVEAPNRYPPSATSAHLSGDALTLGLAGDNPVASSGFALIGGPNTSGYYLGRSHFSEFLDVPPNGVFERSEAITRIGQQLQSAGSTVTLGTQSNGQARQLIDCQFAGQDPTGVMWIRPEDIGNQIEQIPADRTLNTAQHFRFFPNAFFRTVSYVNAVGSAYFDLSSIDSDLVGQPFILRQVEDAPTASTWLVIIDGQPQVVTFAHPAGSDFRRPDEIWNGVIVPIIQNAGGPGTSAFSLLRTASTILPGNGSFINRMRYLQYARLLSMEVNFTDYVQGPISD